MKTPVYLITILVITSIAFVSCKKEKKTVSTPTVTTYKPESVASTVITVGFRVEKDGGSKITDCGLYLGDTQNPESFQGTKLQVASDTGTFYIYVSGLVANTQYYMKAYATNAKGEGLGDQVSFTTPPKITDQEGNSYETVAIGTQSWMTSNLKTVHYMNGDPILSTVPSTFDISGESTPKYQWSYNGDDANNVIYGKLYTYYTVTDSRKICPAGWHVPTDNDWVTLETYLGGANYAGAFLKETGNNHWLSPYNTDAINLTLFTALPGGTRGAAGTYSMINNYGYWWSVTEGDATSAWTRNLYCQSSQIKRENTSKKSGLSVRCIKD
jgi:uncharacterized protein (TIGR02145 family)